MHIDSISAIEVLDSRGNPTIMATVSAGKYKGHGFVPSGASTGQFEAIEMRDSDTRYGGKGVLKAIRNIDGIIQEHLVGESIFNQNKIDAILNNIDGTENKSNLGANATLAVSIACIRAAANAANCELYTYLGGLTADMLPLPMMNIINGGAHADNNLDIQEFMIVPTGAETFSFGLRMCAEIYHTLRENLNKQNYSTTVGDEGGFAPDFRSHEEAIEQIMHAIEKAGYRVGEDVKIALDAAASEWYTEGVYRMPKSGEEFTGDELLDYWEELAKSYPIISIEDPADEEDWDLWQRINKRLKIQIVGDDLFVTNTKRLEEGIHKKAANAIL
ncbi:MAG: phosphopyruvate hydratase, partial [Clostridia bacterium]|nr:phosphopyruvate hydratase [Clostridia bacterium]